MTPTSQPLLREAIPRRFHGVWVFDPGHCTGSFPREHIRVAERRIERASVPPRRNVVSLSALAIWEPSPPREAASAIVEVQIGDRSESFELRLIQDYRYPDPLLRFGKQGDASAEILHRCRSVRQ